MKREYVSIIVLSLLFLTAGTVSPLPLSQADDASPPDRVVKLIFIHHSTGENWLEDEYGGLGLALSRNNYFVSDTNYGWGPDAIGDRTDIPNWTEWFTSGATPRIMQVLFNESGQNSYYTRAVSDPSGENEIILFKSCFPNSALEGNPNDQPGTFEDMTVSGAKYVYNAILQYFVTRPDKLFVVITAPPLSDAEYAANARAFNNWLLNDWLRENNYPLNNVAVFDFYNVLTDPNAHHRFNNGQVEHIYGSRNTLYYRSEDDHPSVQGSRKAADEFVPLLNVFYHRWQSGVPISPPAQSTSALPADEVDQSPISPPPVGTVSLIDDFEGAPPAGSSGWEGYFQDNTDTHIACAPESGTAYGGSASLKFQVDMAPDSWATCGFYFDSLQNWSAGQGISFYLRADRAGIPYNIDLYGGSPDGRITYTFQTQTPAGGENNWTLMEIRWAEILRAEWEENPGTPFNPAGVMGFSIGLITSADERIDGTIWLDDLSLLGAAPASAPEAEKSRLPSLPCIGVVFLPFALIGFFLWKPDRI
jgi:hypothetical protein